MKRHILFICLICGFYSGVNAQTYYMSSTYKCNFLGADNKQ